jgi:hypothetical protein
MNSSTETADEWVLPAEESSAKVFIQANVLLLLYVPLCGLSLIPFLAISQPPIVDFANHAARLTMACHAHDPAIAAMYRYRFDIIPNLAMDFVNLPLCGVVAPARVLQTIITGSLSLIYLSGWIIQRKLFGRANAFLLALPAVAFNLVTTMGYINFLGGVAVTCLMTAFAIGRERRFGTLFLVCNVGGVILFFCHIFALAFAMLIVFGLELDGARLTWKRIFEAGVRTIVLFALPLALIAFVPSAGGQFTFGYFRKVRMLPALFMAQHVSLGLYGLPLLGILYFLIRNRTVEIDRRLRLSLASVGIFVLVIPCSIENAVDLDSRLLVALAYLLFAALRPVRREREITFALVSLSAALVAFQLWSAAAIWRPFSDQMDELREASEVLPARAKVLTIANSEGPKLIAAPLAYSHVTSYVTIERRIFNPLDFTGIGMQPLSVTPAYATVDSQTGQPYSPELANRFISPSSELSRLARENEAGFALRWPKHFDYVIFYHFGRPRNFNPALLEEVRSGSFFTIFKVRKLRANALGPTNVRTT